MPKRITVYPEDMDSELEAMQRFIEWSRYQNFDTNWRTLNYLCIRALGRSWSLSKPASDTK